MKLEINKYELGALAKMSGLNFIGSDENGLVVSGAKGRVSLANVNLSVEVKSETPEVSGKLSVKESVGDYKVQFDLTDSD